MENYSELCSRQLQEVTWTHLELRSRLAQLWQRVTESKIPQRGSLSLELGGPGLVDENLGLGKVAAQRIHMDSIRAHHHRLIGCCK